ADTCILQELGVAIHGRSYASAATTDDLAATYPPPVSGLFNVGILHTNAAGASGGADHGTYAPCTVEELKARGYDYWALGHVHGHQVLSTTPHVVYPGNLQGRNVRETGAKGAVVVDVEGGKVTRLALAPCDVMRWARVEVAAERDDLSFALARKIARAIAEEAKKADGRVLAARIIVTGACAAHGELARIENGARFVADVRAATRDASEAAWVEKIDLKTSPLVDVASLRAAHDLVGDLLRSTHALAASGDLAKSLEPLFLPLRGKVGPALDDAGVRLDDPERLRRYVGDAEAILIELLTGDDRG
ncbi:MAG: DNA repair exonuclease, partial [Polyangiaceae bacterium]